MTFAEALVYASSFMFGGREMAYEKVMSLRGEWAKVDARGTEKRLAADRAMLEEFRAFAPKLEGPKP